MSYQFSLATEADDIAIRQLLAQNPVPGSVSLTYEREPNYFLGCETMGPFQQTIVARHTETQVVAAVANRSIRPRYINGQVEDVGYIGQLRVDAAHQGRWVVPGGFRYFHQLHQDGRVQGYITTIIEGNTMAEGVLVKRARRHYPAYQKVGRICTAAIMLRSAKPKPITISGKIRSAQPADLEAVIRFFRQHGPRKQFFPVYKMADFVDSPVTRGFCLNDLFLAEQNGHLVGVMGLWDQSAYKQSMVRGYSGALRWLRPIYNTGATLLNLPNLVNIGEAIHFAYASFICIADNDSAIFQALLQQVYNLAVERNFAYLMVGLSEDDPLLKVVRRSWHIPYYSTLYTVCWPGNLTFHHKLDSRIPYVEVATL